MVKIEAKPFFGRVYVPGVDRREQRSAVELPLQLNFAMRTQINRHDPMDAVARAPVPWNAISALTMSPVAAPRLALVI